MIIQNCKLEGNTFDILRHDLLLTKPEQRFGTKKKKELYDESARTALWLRRCSQIMCGYNIVVHYIHNDCNWIMQSRQLKTKDAFAASLTDGSCGLQHCH